MKKYLIVFSFFLHTCLLLGQNNRTIQIDTVNARPLNLSQIAEKVTPIVLESPVTIQNVLLTDDYLFITSYTSVVQFDLSGKFIQEINCGSFISTNVTFDPKKRELYVAVGDKIKRYNYAGDLMREYSLNATSLYCLFHNDVLWVLSHVVQSDRIANYTINKINPSSNRLFTLPFEKKEMPIQLPSGGLIQIGAICLLSTYNENVVASFNIDPVLYSIQQDKVAPLVQWDINPPVKDIGDQRPSASGFAGEYLFINYRRDKSSFCYLENMNTGESHNASHIIDDIFHSSGNCNIKSVGENGYFTFHKEKNELTGNNIGGIPLKDGPVVFIVKTK